MTPTIQLDADKRGTHEAHKSEAFSGMQRYHSSEISHKQDAIAVLQSVLTAVVAIYGGLIAAVVLSKVDGTIAGTGAFITLAVAAFGIWQVVAATNGKIELGNL